MARSQPDRFPVASMRALFANHCLLQNLQRNGTQAARFRVDLHSRRPNESHSVMLAGRTENREDASFYRRRLQGGNMTSRHIDAPPNRLDETDAHQRLFPE